MRFQSPRHEVAGGSTYNLKLILAKQVRRQVRPRHGLRRLFPQDPHEIVYPLFCGPDSSRDLLFPHLSCGPRLVL